VVLCVVVKRDVLSAVGAITPWPIPHGEERGSAARLEPRGRIVQLALGAAGASILRDASLPDAPQEGSRRCVLET
jgi:hypothetical protein